MSEGGKKGKKETLSSADWIRLANQAEKQAKENDSNVAWWKEQLASIEDRPTASKYLVMALIALGFTDYIPAFEDRAAMGNDDRVLCFDFVKLVKSKSGHAVHKGMRIQEDPVVWQLRLFGEFMDRSMDSASDPRVSFKPDAWPRKVLDRLDRNESVLVAGASHELSERG